MGVFCLINLDLGAQLWYTKEKRKRSTDMRKIISIISLLLALITVLSSCGTVVPEETTEAPEISNVPDAQTTEVIESTSAPETTAEPEVEKRYLKQPYIDIEFTADGGFEDAMGHVRCNLENKSKGNVVNESVVIGGKAYEIPHLYVKEKGGVGRLTYKEIKEKNQLYELLEGGFTLETLVLNDNAFNSSSGEQGVSMSCQSGGYSFTIYKGKYSFGVYTGGAYSTPAQNSAPNRKEMTHLMGVYDPNKRSATLYVNGDAVSELPAEGILGLATGNGWTTIILGGDTTAECATSTYATNTRIADYKLYASALNEMQIRTAYEQMLAKFTGAEYEYEVVWYEEDETVKGERLFATVAESYAEVYEPKTAMVNSPTVMAYATKNPSATDGIRPATLIFGVKAKDGVLCAYSENGEEISSLYDAVKSLGAKIIPAFAVNDAGAASLLIEFINYHNIGDCFVISSDAEILKSVRGSTRSARPLLDFSGRSALDLKEIKLAVSAAKAKGLILDSSAVSASEVLTLRAYSLSVFLNIESGIPALHDAIFKGAMGVISPDAKSAVEYIEGFKQTTLSFPTMLVAHRGDMQNCPENTLPSFISAAKSGADVIELDVYLTKDGYLAINHDATTSKWDQKLTVTESTRAELKALKNAESDATADDEFAFYEEVVDYFSKNYTDVVFLVEIKDKRNAVIDKVYEVTKAAGMLDRILIICTNHSIVRYAYQTYGVAVQMNRSYIHDKTNLKATLAYACEEVSALNSSFFTVWGDCIYDLNLALRHRGIKYSPWTTTTAAATDSDFALGYPEFTTNTPHRVDGYARYLRAEVSAGGEVKVWRVNYDGSERLVTDEVKLIVLDGEVSFKGGKITGSGTVAFSYSSKIGNYTYEICTQSLMTTKR